MKRNLTSQEKLALAMTSAGSQRNLAALLGITHQKLGRWLKEGEKGGVKEIPADAATLDAINTAFQIHKEITIDQAAVDQTPVNKETPVFQYKKPRRDGKPSDRLFVDGTQYIREELRRKVIQEATATRQYQAVTVRSEFDVESYLDDLVAQEQQRGGKRAKYTKARIKRELREALQNAGILGETKKIAIYTNRVPMGPIYTDKGLRYTPPKFSADSLEDTLQAKHAPSANQPGGKLASMFVFQLAPILKQQQQGTTNAKPRNRKPTNKRGK